MITKEKLLAHPLPARPRRLAPGAEYRAQRQSAVIDGAEVKIYTFYKIDGGQLTPYFRTFCWDNTFTTWVYDHGDTWSQQQAAVNRWSSAMVDKFVLWRQGYDYGAEYHEKYNGRVDGAKIAEQLYQYQSKIRNDALVEKQRRVKMDTARIMEQLGDVPKDLPAFIDNVPLRASRYIYYKTTGQKKVKGKAMHTVDAYCTHCRKDFEQTVPVGSALHNKEGKCPHCRSAVTYKSTGRVSKNLYDDARFAVMQRVSHGIVIRGFQVRREYHGHYRQPKTRHDEFFRVILTFSGHLQYYHWEFVQHPGTTRWDHCGEMQWRRYGRNGFVFPNDAHLYTKNLRYVLRGTPWAYSGLREFAKKTREPFFIEDYLKSYEDHPCLEYLAKLGFTALIEDHLPGYGYSTMGHFSKTDYIRYDTDVVNLWGKSLPEVLPNTDKRDLPLLIRVNADVEVVRLVAAVRKAGRAPAEADVRAAGDVCHSWGTMQKLCRALPFAPLGKAVRYLRAQRDALPVDAYRRRVLVSDWVDYLEMADTAGWDMASTQVLYPEDLKAAHDLAHDQAEIVKSAKHDAAIAAMAEEYRERYAFAYKGLVITVPESAADIIREGQALHHCVGHYVNSVAEATTVILFIRKEDEPDKPYFTLEISPDTGSIRQCRGKNNNGYGDKHPVKKLLDAFKRSRLAAKATCAAG